MRDEGFQESLELEARAGVRDPAFHAPAERDEVNICDSYDGMRDVQLSPLELAGVLDEASHEPLAPDEGAGVLPPEY